MECRTNATGPSVRGEVRIPMNYAISNWTWIRVKRFSQWDRSCRKGEFNNLHTSWFLPDALSTTYDYIGYFVPEKGKITLERRKLHPKKTPRAITMNDNVGTTALTLSIPIALMTTSDARTNLNPIRHLTNDTTKLLAWSALPWGWHRPMRKFLLLFPYRQCQLRNTNRCAMLHEHILL